MESVLAFNEQFSTDEACRKFLEDVRWGNRPKCPRCGRRKAYSLSHDYARPGLHKCARCRQEFTVTVGTIFEDSHVPLPKWFLAIYLIVNAKKGISTNSLSHLLGLTYKTTWFMAHRVRHTMKPINQRRLRGVVEADETYIGGKHHGGKRGRGSESKTPVLALVQREGGVRTQVVQSVNAKTLRAAIKQNVAPSTVMMTDEWKGYLGFRTTGRTAECAIIAANTPGAERTSTRLNRSLPYSSEVCTAHSTTSRNAICTATRTSLGFDGRTKTRAWWSNSSDYSDNQ